MVQDGGKQITATLPKAKTEPDCGLEAQIAACDFRLLPEGSNSSLEA